jgi:hypothetical protein
MRSARTVEIRKKIGATMAHNRRVIGAIQKRRRVALRRSALRAIDRRTAPHRTAPQPEAEVRRREIGVRCRAAIFLPDVVSAVFGRAFMPVLLSNGAAQPAVGAERQICGFYREKSFRLWVRASKSDRSLPPPRRAARGSGARSAHDASRSAAWLAGTRISGRDKAKTAAWSRTISLDVGTA